MKNFNLVKLECSTYSNLSKGNHGIVVEANHPKSKILFFNEQNIGDFCIVEILNTDLFVEKETLPKDFEKEVTSKLAKVKTKDSFTPITIKEYDWVELMIDDDKYAQQGIYKGAQGCVMSPYAMNNTFEVDFSCIDENGQCYGDCIIVEIKDLKLL